MARAHNLISLTEAAEALGVHYMTAYRYVRTGRLAASKDGHEWQVAAADVDALRRQLGQPAPVPAAGAERRSRRRDYPERLVECLLRSDEAGAWNLIDAALAGGMEPAGVYLDLLTPALDTIGERWARDEITVADEHRASAIVLRLIGRLGPRFARRGRKRGTIVLGTPPGESHSIPTALLRDLLRGRGYDVIDLGADVPADSWAATLAATPRLVSVGLCATTAGNDEGLRATVAAIRSATAAPIVLGGRGITGHEHAVALGATACSASFEDAARQFDELTGT